MCYDLFLFICQLAITRLILQGSACEGLSTEVAGEIFHVQESVDGWMAYKIARLAARYSHHSLAAGIFSRLMGLVRMITILTFTFQWNVLSTTSQHEQFEPGDLDIN